MEACIVYYTRLSSTQPTDSYNTSPSYVLCYVSYIRSMLRVVLRVMLRVIAMSRVMLVLTVCCGRATLCTRLTKLGLAGWPWLTG